MTKVYKALQGIALLFAFVLLNSKESKASHAMGSDLTYTCIGNNQYILTFSFYRDCDGIDAPDSLSINFSNTCGLSNPQTIWLQPTPTSPTQISPLCPTATSTCNGGTFTGIQEWVYTDTVTLPGPCATWTLSHSENARNAAITTITGAGSDNLFVYTNINNTNGICNSSPVFSNKPVPFACLGQRFCFNHGAFDPDGDSLSYRIITPRTGPNPADTVTYISPYTASQPVVSSPPMYFNPATGDFCMTPQQLDVTVLAIVVSEWRNGVLLSEIERDIQVTVLNCNNRLPTITGINGAPSFSATVCAGNQLCFFVASIDPDAANTTIITWDQSIPGATFDTTRGHRDTATFCWTPPASAISNTPYCFTVTVSDDNCPYIGVQVYSFCITVRGVDPDAGPDQTIPCGATANLVGSATGGNGTYSYTWQPGNVNSQTLNGVGVGTYILEVASAGCTNRDTMQVLPGAGNPAANFSFVTSCAGMPVQFTDNSSVTGSSISSWSWDFGDGSGDNTQNPVHQFGSNGSYTVTLTVSTPTGCTASYSQLVNINTNIPAAQFTAPGVCDGSSMSFLDQSLGGPITSWSWDFGDPASGSNTSALQNPTHTFTAPGTYSVTLSVENSDGCQHQAMQSVTVHPNPVILVVDAGMCEGATAVLDGPANYASYSWSSGQNTQSITVSPAATSVYSLTVTDVNGCVGSTSATVTVDPLPIPDAGVDQTICEGTNANLSGLGATNYVWNPGNISGQNVTVSPATTTVYTVTASFNSGCSATDIVTVNVNPMPAAIAGNDIQICEGESATINAVTGAGSILWTPGNFNTSSITVTPATTTTYNLLVSDAIGCSGTDDITVFVNQIPAAGFVSSGPVCKNLPVTFTDQSAVGTGSITSWRWDFGNNVTSNAQNPSLVYNDYGDYNVTLIVTTDGGCKDTTNLLQSIWAVPVASFNHNNVCVGNSISFTNASTIEDGSALIYDWNLGDGTFSASTDIVHQYASWGAYPATLVATSINGCVSSHNSLANVYPLPTAAFSVNHSCEDDPASFADNSSIPQGVINSWFWTFGDGQSTTESNPSHVYFNSGDYNIHLRVSSDQGCPDSTNGSVRIVPKPLVDFATEDACLGYTVDFTQMAQQITGPIVQYEWTFGDGNTSMDPDPTHMYGSHGWFDVSLTVTSDSGCVSKLTRANAVNIFAPPVPRFYINATEANDIYPLVHFLNQSSGGIHYYWSFGDGDTTSVLSPTHLYPGVGEYDVQLIAVDSKGCIDSTIVRFEIKPTSNIYIPNAFTPNGDSKNDYFRVYSYNVVSMEVQIYDRWGLKIVEWDSMGGLWDGKVNGDPAQADTYVYRVSTIDVNNKKEVRLGQVSLVR